MGEFYVQLAKAIKEGRGDIWTETVLEGEHAGEKRLIAGPDACGAPVRVYRERVRRAPKLAICGAGHVSMPIIRL